MNVMYLNGGIYGITSWNGLGVDPASRKLPNNLIRSR